jgi:hypothetical protein
VLFAALAVRVTGWSGLAEDSVHFCSAGRAAALGHPAPVRLGGFAVEVAFFLAFHAVPVVALGQWWCLSVRGLGRRSALTGTVLGEETAIAGAEGLRRRVARDCAAAVVAVIRQSAAPRTLVGTVSLCG